MTQPELTPDTSVPPSPQGITDTWLNPRRKRFWAILLVLLYTLTGFLLVPFVVKSLLIGTLRDDFGREAAVDRVRFNPYVMSLEVNGFTISDPDTVELAGFDRFFVNFQLSSLFRWAWTFREIRIDALRIRYERFAPGDDRLTRLLADHAARTPPQEAGTEVDGDLPRLLIEELTLSEGAVRFSDHVPAETVEFEFGPIDISINELNTLPDRDGRQTVHVRMPEGALLSWEGSLDLGPLRSAGRFSIENSSLEQTISYLEAILPLQSVNAILSLQSGYRVDERDDGSLEVELEGLDAELRDVAVTGLQPATEFVTFQSLRLSGGTLSYPGNTLHFSSINLQDPGFLGWLDEAGEFSLLQLVGEPAVEADEPGQEPSTEQVWRIGVDEFVVSGGRIGFADRSISPQAEFDIHQADLTVRDISNDAGARFPVTLTASPGAGGAVGFEGQLAILPEFTVSGTATVSGIPLALAQPYAQQQVNILIAEGTLDTSTELELHAGGNVTASGNLAIAGLLLDDTLENQPLLSWDRLEVDRFELATQARRLELSTVKFKEPYGRLVIRKDLTTNLSSLVIEDDTQPQSPPAAGTDEPGFAVVIGGTDVRDGSMDFSDLSLPLPFATYIRRLEGTVSTIDTTSAAPANIRLEGKVDDYGLARIDGAMDLFDPVRSTDVTMEFRNLLMSNLSPYVIDFAGREIDEGKLDLDLTYRIFDGQLQGQNALVMRDLVLGKEVDSPNAVSLPLDLAVALLTDANGVIDIDLPVTGDVNDPEFKIGGVIWKALAGLITKVITAPFRLLGSLIGIESEDLGQFEFLAGRADLTPPELEKIEQLRQALNQRPELNIEVPAAYEPRLDGPALQFLRLKAAVIERLGPEYEDQQGEFRMLNEQIRGTLEELFAERFPGTDLEPIRASHTAPPEGDPEGKPVLDELAYAADLRDRLLESEVIGTSDLEALGMSRADAVRDAFLATGDFAETRIRVADPVATESGDDEWVVMELAVAAE